MFLIEELDRYFRGPGALGMVMDVAEKRVSRYQSQMNTLAINERIGLLSPTAFRSVIPAQTHG
jgi:hypothetical protein